MTDTDADRDAAYNRIDRFIRVDIAAAIHYPDCWDQDAYPTLASALNEMASTFHCTNDNCPHHGPMGDCGNAECGWRGPVSECSYLGSIGPCCPRCREIVESDAVQAATDADIEGDPRVIQFMAILHANVPEDQRPKARSDFSDDQWARACAAFNFAAAPAVQAPQPVAMRYQTGAGKRWRYLNYPFTKGWDFPASLGTLHPLYAAVPASPARLTDAQIDRLDAQHLGGFQTREKLHAFARAIESEVRLNGGA